MCVRIDVTLTASTDDGRPTPDICPPPPNIELSVGRPPNPTWKRPPGRPRTKWTEQLRRDNNNVPPFRLCGGKLLVAVTRERRYGPSRLRVLNDDDDDEHQPSWTPAPPRKLLSRTAAPIMVRV